MSNPDSPKPPFGTFQRAAAPPAEPRRDTPAATSSAGATRLNKRMAELGLASRREADDWIARGWVKVNGSVAAIGMQVTPQARIEVAKQAQGQQANQVTILLNKPMALSAARPKTGTSRPSR